MNITVITINYNSAEYTTKLLDSLSAQTDNNFSVIVVDNASAQDDIQKLKIHLPFPRFATGYSLIANPINLGFAGGVNVGIKQALQNGANWLILLNNDTTVEFSFIGHIRAILRERRGIVGLALSEGEDRVAYGSRVTWLRTRGYHMYQKSRVPQKPTTNCRYYAIGGAMAIHCDTIAKIGLWDENYFLYFEDPDFSIRAQRAGVPLSFTSDIRVTHTVFASTKHLGTTTILRYHMRNSLYFNRKLGPWWVRLLLWPWSAGIFLLQTVKIIVYWHQQESHAIRRGVFDFYYGRFGKIT